MSHAPRFNRVTAILGPTNTGKTHYAVERMLGHVSGMMGFPLRLLAREVYDRVVKAKGPTRVALITGEEKIVPPQPAYWICTVEAMPMNQPVAFLAVDEIQLAADWQRGHIFTHRLMRARGEAETLFMGSDTIRPMIERLIPDCDFINRPRFSTLTHLRPVKLSRLPRRSAIVAFSAESVYVIAELVRRQRGGTALVMGALSPRTRNAQVELYQSGEVDYLVATDAIGMGLNMDIDHVAFAATNKFDGRNVRALTASEVGQIAGRAGRHTRDGSFSTIGGETLPLDPALISQVEDHDFPALKQIWWRHADLEFSSVGRLIRSLEEPSRRDDLLLNIDNPDIKSLKALANDPAIEGLATNPAQVRKLWQVCQIPDFRRIAMSEHITLLKRIFSDLSSQHHHVDEDWIAEQVSYLDNIQGDIDTLAARIASIRTWTYVANRPGWVKDAAHWAHVTRGVEDKLSDALHDRLTQRFVDRRTSVLMRQLRQRGSLAVTIDDANQIVVEGHTIGHLEGFTFRADPSAVGEDYKTLESAAGRALQGEIARRAKIFANIGYKTLTIDTTRGMNRATLNWHGFPIVEVMKGGNALSPDLRLTRDTMLEGTGAELVLSKCREWLTERLNDKLEPLQKLAAELALAEPSEDTAPLVGTARGVAFSLKENFGVMARENVASELRQLDQDARKGLRRFGIRIGAVAIYQPLLLKPHAVELRLILWSLWHDIEKLPSMPTPGLVTIEAEATDQPDFYTMAGFRLVGKHAVRIDMLERLADAVRPLGQNGATFEVTPEIMGLVGCSGDAFVEVMGALHYTADRRMEPKSTRQPAVDATAAETDVETPLQTGSIEADIQPAPGVLTDANLPEHRPSSEAPAPSQPVATEDAPSKADVSTPSKPPGDPTDVTEPAVLPEPEVERTGSGPDKAAADDAPPPDEEMLVERLYFTWAGDRARRKGNKGPRQQGKGRKPDRNGQRPDGKGGKKNRSAQNERRGRPASSAKAKPVDKDSPFYQLMELKQAMEKKK